MSLQFDTRREKINWRGILRTQWICLILFNNLMGQKKNLNLAINLSHKYHEHVGKYITITKIANLPPKTSRNNQNK